MGKLYSKYMPPQPGMEPAKEILGKDDRDDSWKVKRNSYVLFPGQDNRMANVIRCLAEKVFPVRTSLTQDEVDEHLYEMVVPDDSRPLSTPYVNVSFLRANGHIRTDRIRGSPESVEAMSLRFHYRELKDRVELESVCDHFIQDNLLMDIDYERIMNGVYIRRVRVDILLQIILRQKSLRVFETLILALRNTGCQDLADRLETTKGAVLEKPYMRDWNTTLILTTWPKIEMYLMNDLQPEYVLDFFMQENIFTVDEYEEVFWLMGERIMMTRKLLDKIKDHLPDALFVLIYALKKVNKGNEIIAAEIENLVINNQQDASVKGEEESNTDVRLIASHVVTLPLTGPKFSSNPVRAVKLTIEKEGNVTENVEIEINKYINHTNTACLLEVFLPLTGCEIEKSERGCVTIHLRPHSKHAFDKLCKFCNSKELENFVLNLLREKDILNSLPEGELCINIKVQYHDEEVEAQAAEEPETDWKNVITDNWSFLCEELDVHNLIKDSGKDIFSDQETNELQQRSGKSRHEAVDYFLKLLLQKGQDGVSFLIDGLKKKNKMKIVNRLQRSGPLYQNPQTVKENIIHHFESIIDEIDTTQFKDAFMDRKILDNTFFTALVKSHPRRRPRVAMFLREVLNKGNNAIFALLDVMTDIGCDELLEKLAKSPPEETTLESKQQRKDETKEKQSGNTSENEDPIYKKVSFDNHDEGIGETDKTYVTMRSKEGKNQIDRPATHPENKLSRLVEREKSISFPRTRESEEASKDTQSLNSEASRVINDSGVDLSETKERTCNSIEKEPIYINVPFHNKEVGSCESGGNYVTKDDEIKEDSVRKDSHRSSPKVFSWSCCLTINVEKKAKDEIKEKVSCNSSANKEHLYMTVPLDKKYECIGEADSNYVTMRSKDNGNKANRHVLLSENSFARLELDKSMTFTTTGELEEARKSIHSHPYSDAVQVINGNNSDLSNYEDTKLVFHDTHFL